MEKGFKTLELLGDLDDKYIYEASRPWKKQHRFFHIQRSWKTVAAGVIAYYGWMHIKISGRCKSSITESNFMDRTGIGN